MKFLHVASRKLLKLLLILSLAAEMFGKSLRRQTALVQLAKVSVTIMFLFLQ